MKELKEVVGENIEKIEHHHLNKLIFLQAFVYETQRFYNPLTNIINRKVLKDHLVEDMPVLANDMLVSILYTYPAFN